MPGGTLPYGYMQNSKDIKKKPREVEMVKVIFSLEAHTKSGQEIADYLNAKGCTRRNGTPWTQRQD